MLNSSSIGVVANRNINWNDKTDLSLTTSIPKISTSVFNTCSHVGVIVVPEHDCGVTSLTLAQKLERGHVYERAESNMFSLEDGIGKSVLGDTSWVRSITALEFCGYVMKTIDQLDRLSAQSRPIQQLQMADFHP